jgi:Ran GTPase-activating protein (RanGAP) involved in mRNA processing and transport
MMIHDNNNNNMNNNNDDDMISLHSTYNPLSPRAIFINGCLKNNIPPITIALVRRNLTSTINLAHMGIGDKIAVILSKCLNSLPYLEKLNLSDNHLKDKGLTSLIHSVAKHPDSLVELDISSNKVGIKASYALAKYLGNSLCKLKTLKVRSANIDDNGCVNMCKVLQKNKYLTELDLSKNNIGKEENLNAVKPSFLTGGESLAILLSNKNCPLQKLTLHWNMIRLNGANKLCESIDQNSRLVYIDLSYNAIGNYMLYESQFILYLSLYRRHHRNYLISY